jgi:RNA polymerase sigma-70 factor (ECF subfamily)
MPESFRARFVDLFDAHFHRLYRYLDRLAGDPELAADLAQETFVKLYRRGSLPDAPEAWLITVAMNLFRNVKSTRARRRRLLTIGRAEAVMADPPALPGEPGAETRSEARARTALDRLPERDRQLLLLRAEGYRYREIAVTLELNEASVGTLLARAKQAFREVYEATSDAS